MPVAAKDVALIIGTSARMAGDLARFDSLDVEAEVFAVNNAARLVDRPIDHFVAIDLPTMLFCVEGLPDVKVHTIDEPGHDHARVDCLWHFDNRVLRMSGIFAATIAIAMGHRKVLLAGCGMDASGQTAGTMRSSTHTNVYPSRWTCLYGKTFMENCRDYIRSFSGLTGGSFGAPTRGFLDGNKSS